MSKSSSRLHDGFRRLSEATAAAMGTPLAFAAAVLIVAAWLLSGPLFHYSDTWQLVINTGTTIVTFLMVFLIQATQNRDTKILNLKIDELIRAIEGARNDFASLEELSDEALEKVHGEFRALRDTYGVLLHDDIAAVEATLSRRHRGPRQDESVEPNKTARSANEGDRGGGAQRR